MTAPRGAAALRRLILEEASEGDRFDDPLELKQATLGWLMAIWLQEEAARAARVR